MAAGEKEDLTAEDLELLAKREAQNKARMELFASLEKRIGIPYGFFWSLRKEQDDWAYIVKLAVICEAAVTHALVMHVKNNDLLEHFSDLPQARRLELAKHLGIVSDADRLTLGAIAGVRNSFAHRVENLGGSLEAFFHSRTQEQKIDLITKLVQLEGQDKPKRDDDMSGHGQFFKTQLFACAMRPLQSIANFGLDVDKKAEEERLKNMILSDLFRGDVGADGWWNAGSSPVNSADTPLVMRAAAKPAAEK